MINGINTVVTSIYELKFVDERGKSIYKNFHLLSDTIRSIIFPEYNYVIYTDQSTFEKHNFNEVFTTNNVTIKIVELNSEFYLQNLNPIRSVMVQKGEIYERIYAVENYVEVMYNKLQFLLNESEKSDNVVWIDAGLFGTSCHDNWRDHMRNNLVYNKNFLDKVFEKIANYNFFALKGEKIHMHYEIRDRINKITGEDLKLIPGGIFGGKSEFVKDIFKEHQIFIEDYVNTYKQLTSDQEILSVLTCGKNVKFFEFDDWNDFQKGILQILDMYDDSKYKTDKCYEN